ncbi:MAG TPA: hypothetical protein PLU30_07735 [Verrucomicrobiae bacterium]|nr:hypothetical protein [Verrucomicrobiae bacterium]
MAGLLLLPDAAMAAAFAVAWSCPDTPGAATLIDCKRIMLLEGLSILGAALLGIYLEVALVFLPLIMVSLLVYLLCGGSLGWTWLLLGFVWYLGSSFANCVLARHGHYGSARENPAHPHRRYDRMLLLYLATAPLLLMLRVGDHPAMWAIWGTAYFATLALADTVLRSQFDRIPQGLVRRCQAWARPVALEEIGICTDCTHVQPAIPQRKGHLVRCALSATDPRFPEQPPTPVRSCAGFRARPKTP